VEKIKDYLHGVLTVEGKRLCLCVCVCALKYDWLINAKYLLIHIIAFCRNKENVYLISGIYAVSGQEDWCGKLIIKFM